jgi:hypothetical protein
MDEVNTTKVKDIEIYTNQLRKAFRNSDKLKKENSNR